MDNSRFMFGSWAMTFLLWGSCALLAIRTALLCVTVAGEPGGLIRAVFGVAFCLILLRRAGVAALRDPDHRPHASTLPLVLGLGATVLTILGLVFRVHQFEWIGFLTLTYACCRFALPPRALLRVRSALFLLYWVHPLPGQIEGATRLGMQRLSTVGAEWLLHIMNVPAWADGLVLYTGAGVLEVPQACSGMRTATAVFMCALGTGMAFRFSRRALVGFTCLGVAQGLFLNALRIAMVARLTTGEMSAHSQQRIHDSTGVLMLAAVLLLQVEALIWCRWLHQRVRNWETRRQKRIQWQATPLGVMHRALLMVTVLILAAGSVFAAYKRRPAHRAAMISGMVEALSAREAEAAEKAAAVVIKLDPMQNAYRLSQARIWLMRGKCDRVLAEFRGGALGCDDLESAFLKVQALAGSGALDEAEEILEALSLRHPSHPSLAMALAECAHRRGNPDRVAANVVRARSQQLLPRVRACFPYLAAQGRWQAIADADGRAPHQDVGILKTSVTANLLLGRFAATADMLRENESLWILDPDFLQHVGILARRDTGEQSKLLFVKALRANLPDMNVDELVAHVETCMQIGQQDAAVEALQSLHSHDPDHPGVFLLAARRPAEWSALLAAQTDALPDMLRMPSGRQEKLETCLRLLEGRAQQGALSIALSLMRSEVLTLLGRYDEAQAGLDRVEAEHAGSSAGVVTRRAVLCALQKDWGRVYEILRKTDSLAASSDPVVTEMLVQAALNLDLGLLAMLHAEAARARLPSSPPALASLALVWESFGYDEEALFTLDPYGDAPPSAALVRLLAKTGRVTEALRVRRLLSADPVNARTTRNPFRPLPPAELAVTWIDVTPPPPVLTTPVAMAATNTSYLADELSRLTAGWEARHGDQAAEPESHQDAGARDRLIAEWSATGRDPMEKAAALHRLALLQAQAGDREAAAWTLDAALSHAPAASVLWRLRAALSGGDSEQVKQARQHCPHDSEIWLAQLVGTVRRGEDVAKVLHDVRDATANRRFSVGTFVRAADFLFRNGLHEAAADAARHALTYARGYLPAYAVAAQCVAAVGDGNSISYALQGAQYAENPEPFLRFLVRRGMEESRDDPALVFALKSLIETDPQNREWRERLGAVLFEQEAYGAACTVFASLLQTPDYKCAPGIATLAAESLRRSRRQAEAVGVLRDARRRFPDNTHILNNLVYALQENAGTLGEARTLLPELLSRGTSPAAHHTAAMVYYRCGSLDEADASVRKALAALPTVDSAWGSVTLDAVEIALAREEHDHARELLAALHESGNTGALDPRRLRLLKQRLASTR